MAIYKLICAPCSGAICTFMFAESLLKPGTCLMVEGNRVIEDACPPTFARRFRRRDQSISTKSLQQTKRQKTTQYPFWTLHYNYSASSIQLLNANFGSSGCLHVAESDVTIGSCANERAAMWDIKTIAGPETGKPIGVIVGVTVAGVVAVGAIGVFVYLWRGRRGPRKSELVESDVKHSVSKSGTESTLVPSSTTARNGSLGSETTAVLPQSGPLATLAQATVFIPRLADGSESEVYLSPHAAPDDPSHQPQPRYPPLPPPPQQTTSDNPTLTSTTQPPTTPFAPFPKLAPKLLITESEVTIDRSRKLGEGGFGTVHLGLLRGSLPVAVKTLHSLDPAARVAFAREVQTWQGLVQRNVLPLMAVCLDPPMMVTDFMEQGNLRQFLTCHTWDQTLGKRLLADVARGMVYLHSLNILHGDLKSLNILVDDRRAVITDFGLSKLVPHSASASARSAGPIAGTPGFVAPEVLAGGEGTAKSDVYSFGMVGYEVVSRGGVPFEGAGNYLAMVRSRDEEAGVCGG